MFKKSLIGPVLATGFALFSMFFGSGNLVFPLQVGLWSGGNVGAATLGFLLTGVLVPCLGALVVLSHEGCHLRVFRHVGFGVDQWFPLLALSLMGPFGVLPRCITVAQGSFETLVPGVSEPLFVMLACTLLFAVCVVPSRLLRLLGVFLTPALLGSLLCVLYFGFQQELVPSMESTQASEAAWIGFFRGYQTMDLLAALFFSSFVIQQMRLEAKTCGEHPLRLFAAACALGMTLLGAVYFALIRLGATFTVELQMVPPQQILSALAVAVLGSWGAIFVAFVILTCLTTAIVLTSLFARHLHEELLPGSLTYSQAVGITLGIAFLVSLFEFAGIAAYIGPILEVLYPAIVLTCLHLVAVRCGWMGRQAWIFPLVSGLSLGVQLMWAWGP